MQVNVAEAKKDLSKLLQLIETGEEIQIDIARYGEPIATVTAFQKPFTGKRIGVAEGILKVPDDFDKYDDEIAELFGGTL